jgi:hypothetical protein
MPRTPSRKGSYGRSSDWTPSTRHDRSGRGSAGSPRTARFDQLRKRRQPASWGLPDFDASSSPEHSEGRLWAALLALRVDRRTPIVLHYVLDYSFDEVAAILSVPGAPLPPGCTAACPTFDAAWRSTMQADLDELLRTLPLSIPEPDDGFEDRLRTEVARRFATTTEERQPVARRAWPRRGVVLLAVAAILTASGLAYASSALVEGFFASSTDRAIVSNEFELTAGTPASMGPVAAHLSCRSSSTELQCVPRDRATSTADTARYVLADRAGATATSALAETAAPLEATPATRSLWIFATGSTRLTTTNGFPPIIACSEPSTIAPQACVPVLRRSVLPIGTPIYQNVASGG